MKKTQLLLATSKSRDTHPLPVGDTFQNSKAREA